MKEQVRSEFCMKRIVLLIICCACLLFSACSAAEENRDIPRFPWPSHAPEATPYVRKADASTIPPDPDTNAETYNSLEELLASIYKQEANFFILDWELEMFKALPQDEPYNFVVHLEPLTGLELETAMAAAQEFYKLGVKSEVRANHSIYGGTDDWAYTCIIQCTPEKLWEISSLTENLYHVEQLYETVAQRFDTLIWPEEEHG